MATSEHHAPAASAQRRGSRAVLLACLASVMVANAAAAQEFVRPERAHKARVKNFDLEWRHVDIETDVPPQPDDEPERDGERRGGIRLYYYAAEQSVAELAAASITTTYRELAKVFGYTPTRVFPYILYNTYQEFLETNLFPLQEGVLGVTSPVDLTLTLPYFGDHRLFAEVSRHELVHQFTIQKLRSLAERHEVSAMALLEVLPLWFIEGIAEYYTHSGLDPETEMIARDLVVHASVEDGYGVVGFFRDLPGSILWTYKLGQTRAAFLEEVYGPGILQRTLDGAADLIARLERDDEDVLEELAEDQRSGEERTAFQKVIERLCAEDSEAIDARFSTWLKSRAYRSYLDVTQHAPSLEKLRGLRDAPEALAASPDGALVLYRTTEPGTGTTELVLLDPERPREPLRVVADGRPGAESLHPVARRNFALANDGLAYVAQVEGYDVLYWRSVARDDDELELGRTVAHRFNEHDLVGIEAVSFSPDGQELAFIGTTTAGLRDIFVCRASDEDATPERLTDDLWTERSLAYGQAGIVYTSDATEDRHFNLFRVARQGGPPERLSREQRDELDPLVLPDGRIFFVAFEHGRADVHELVEGTVVRRSDVATGLFDLSPGRKGGLWARWLQGGEFHLVHLDAEQLAPHETAELQHGGPPLSLIRRPLVGSQEYDPTEASEWQLGPLFGILGAGGGSIYGQILASASDRLRDHTLLLDVAIYGRPELTDGYLLYLNQVGRLSAGGGPFQSLRYRVERTYDGTRFVSLERFIGGLGLLRVPLDTFRYVEAELSVGAASQFLDEPERAFLGSVLDPNTGETLRASWEAQHDRSLAQGRLTLRLGYDTIRYHAATGPLDGASLLLENALTAQAEADEPFGTSRLDLARYFHLTGSTNFFVRAGAGTAWGGRLATQFYLSSFETLRGVGFGDTDFLLGKRFFTSTAELQFPLGKVIRILFFPNMEGVLGLDFGAAANRWDELWEKRVLDVALGVNFIIGPLVLELHFARPLDTGARPTAEGQRLASPSAWVTNFWLNWLYL